jgi:hypothetical protein
LIGPRWPLVVPPGTPANVVLFIEITFRTARFPKPNRGGNGRCALVE